MICLKVKSGKFNNKERCREFANIIACIVQGYDSKEIPYNPNEFDWRFWTIDEANNWKVQFFISDENCFGVVYRYQCEANPHEEALVEWLKIRLESEITKKPEY